MKSIKNALFAIMICVLVSMSFAGRSQTKNTILIQSADSKISSQLLSQSADVISLRLKNFYNEEFDLQVIPKKHQIQLILTDKTDLSIAEKLITQKGKLEFYEAFDYPGFTKLIQGDTSLLTLFQEGRQNASSATITCIQSTEKNKLDDKLEAAGLNKKCKLAWSNCFNNGPICLYALRIEPECLIPLSGKDIQSFESKQDDAYSKYYMEFRFGKAATAVWAEVTKRNINKTIAIVLDDIVLYSPMVVSEITGGNCQVSGDFSKTQVKYMAAIGTGGELPAIFKVVK